MSLSTVELNRDAEAVPAERGRAGPSASTTAVAVSAAAVWLATLLASLYSPDLINGSLHEHLPLAAITDWPWAVFATGYILMAAQSRGGSVEPAPWIGFAAVVTAIWSAVALASIYAPQLVTGTDPTSIPLAAIVAPVAGMVATGFACLHLAVTRARA